MTVQLTIEAGQIADTVVELFKNLTPEDRKELAYSIAKEAMIDPDFYETKSIDAMLIQEYRDNKTQLSNQWGYGNKIDPNKASDDEIRSTTTYKNDLEARRNTKKILIGDAKDEIVKHYRDVIAEELKTNPIIDKILQETFKEVCSLFPKLVMESLVLLFANTLPDLQQQIQLESYRRVDLAEVSRQIMNRIGINDIDINHVFN
jgi:hypothetical protein